MGAAWSSAVWRMSCPVLKQRTGCPQMQTRDLVQTEEIKILSLLPYGQAWPFNGSWLTGQDRTGVCMWRGVQGGSNPHSPWIHLSTCICERPPIWWIDSIYPLVDWNSVHNQK